MDCLQDKKVVRRRHAVGFLLRICLLLGIDHEPASDAPLQARLIGADSHENVDVSSLAWASEDGVLHSKLGHWEIDIVGLRGAVLSAIANGFAAGAVGADHAQTLVMAGAGAGAVALGAVDERHVVPDLVVDDAVFKLGLGAAAELVGLADLEGCSTALTGAAKGLGVLGASRNIDSCRRAFLVYGPDPDIVRAAVVENSVTSKGKASLHSRKKEGGGLGEHHCDGVRIEFKE